MNIHTALESASFPRFPFFTKARLAASDVHHHHNRFTALFRDHPDESVPEENFWTFWCKERLTEADTNHPAGRHSIWTNQSPPPPSHHFLQAGCPSCRPTNSVKALKD